MRDCSRRGCASCGCVPRRPKSPRGVRPAALRSLADVYVEFRGPAPEGGRVSALGHYLGSRLSCILYLSAWMQRFLLILAVLVLATDSPVMSQVFPEPGTGLLTFERVGNDRRLQIPSFVFSHDGTLFASADSLYRFETAPSGLPAGYWTALSSRRSLFSAIATVGFTSDTLLAGWFGGLFRSVNGGLTWASVHRDGPDKPEGFYALPSEHVNANRLLAGGRILYSDDRGRSWTEASRTFPGEQGWAHAFTALPSGRVLMRGSWGVAASDDGGESYTVTSLWGDYLFETYSITSLATPGSVQSGAPDCGQSDPMLCDGAVVIGIDATAPHVRAWRTNDGGRTWSEPVPLPEPEDGVGAGATAGIVALEPGSDALGRALMVGGRGVIYRTMDGASTWQVIGRLPVVLGGLSHRVRYVQIGPDGHLWVATSRNGAVGDFMYRSTQPAETAFPVSGESGPAQDLGFLLAIHPNPAGDSAVLRVTPATPVTSAVIDVYDSRGREIARLHDGPLEAERSIDFSATGWAPGVYIVRIVYNELRMTTARFVVVTP